MNPRLFFLTIGLVALLIASCAPEAVSTPVPPIEVTPPAETIAGEPMPLPAATSRGTDLEATDPTTVSLASGGLQLVEFFRFT